jgi:hypothetical protein
MHRLIIRLRRQATAGPHCGENRFMTSLDGIPVLDLSGCWPGPGAPRLSPTWSATWPDKRLQQLKKGKVI